MEKVRAKFSVSQILKDQFNNTVVRLYAVYDDGVHKENASFAASTPSGNVELYITNPAAAEFFTLGRQVYLDFTPADVPAERDDPNPAQADATSATETAPQATDNPDPEHSIA